MIYRYINTAILLYNVQSIQGRKTFRIISLKCKLVSILVVHVIVEWRDVACIMQRKDIIHIPAIHSRWFQKMLVMVCSPNSRWFQKNVGNMLFSKSSMTRLATTTGKPMAVPWTCLHYLPWQWNSVEFKNPIGNRSWSVLRQYIDVNTNQKLEIYLATLTTSVCTDVNRETTSIETNSSFFSNFNSVPSTHCLEFLRWCSEFPTKGDGTKLKCLEKAYLGEPIKFTTGFQGIPGFRIFMVGLFLPYDDD